MLSLLSLCFVVMTSAFVTYPVGGGIYPDGVFTAHVSVGTPPQTVRVALDTGSPYLLVPQANCTACTTRPRYNPAASSTAQLLSNRPVEYSYETCVPNHPNEVCSLSAMQYRDDIVIGDLPNHHSTTVGSIVYQTSNFDQLKKVDGIIGLMPNSQVIQDAVGTYGLCVQGHKGRWSVNGIDPSLHKGDIRYVKNKGGFEGFWGININDILVGNKSSGISFKQGVFTSPAILDSGTTSMNIPQKDIDKIQALMPQTSLVSQFFSTPGGCLNNVDPRDIVKLPDWTVVLDNNINVNIPAAQYIVYNTQNQACLQLYPTNQVIVGNIFMSTQYIVFDSENAQIGFAQATSQCFYGN